MTGIVWKEWWKIVTAWLGDKLIGVARSMTDFHSACYLSDLAVHKNHQKKGIGKKLLAITQEQLGPPPDVKSW